MHGGDRFLRAAAAVYAVGLVLHGADHARRGTDVLTAEVIWAGNLSTILGLLAIVLVFARHRLAPLMAVVTGFSVGPGVAAAHLLPRWSAFSDAFPGGHDTGVAALSWAVVLIEIAGALMLGLAGVSALQQAGELQSAPTA
jgi:hypothetical protein